MALHRADEIGFDDIFGGSRANPIRSLIAHVVQRALFDTFAVEPCLQREALKWCYSDSTEPWTIYWCMDQLDVLACLPQLRRRIPELRKIAEVQSDNIYGAGYFQRTRQDAEDKLKSQRVAWRTGARELSEELRLRSSENPAVLRLDG